jgi:hypothetical protein
MYWDGQSQLIQKAEQRFVMMNKVNSLFLKECTYRCICIESLLVNLTNCFALTNLTSESTVDSIISCTCSHCLNGCQVCRERNSLKHTEEKN